MASIEQFQRVKRDFMRIAQQAGLPEPDEIHYHDREGADDEVEFIWHDQRLAVVVELDESLREAVPDPPF